MMQTTTEATVVQNGKLSKKPLVPPDEKFWKRYSPHHEAPVSGVSSLTLHILIPALVAIYFLVFGKYLEEARKPPSLGIVAIGNPNAGGGGVAGGVEGGPDTKEAVPPADEQIKDQKPDATPAVPTEPLQVKPPESNINLPNENLEKAPISQQAVVDAQRSLEDLKQTLLNRQRPGNPGKGGTGSGGGDGSGKGKGIGSGTEPGVQGSMGSDREKRILRWTLRFSTLNGGDYAKQLAGLGAILAIPQANGTFRVIRDLTPPVKGEVEDINSINRIFWIDNQPDSVQSLARALRLNPIPPYIVAFFPEALEKRLLEKEKKASGGKGENQIKETRFVVERTGGSYDVRVTHQQLN